MTNQFQGGLTGIWFYQYHQYSELGPFFSVLEDRKGTIWFSSVGSGVYCYNGQSFIKDKTGRFWFGTRGHACMYDGKTFTVLTHQGKPFTNVRTIIEYKKGNIWLGGADGLWHYDGQSFTNFLQQFVGYIIEDRKGNIWTSSESGKDKQD